MAALQRDGRHDVVPGTVEAPRASPAEAVRAVAALEAAVTDRDAGGLTVLAPEGDQAARTLLDGIDHNVRALDVRRLRARYVDQSGTVAPDGSWTGVVELGWRFDGYDAGTSSAEVLVRFVPDVDRLAIAGFEAPTGTGRARLPLWLRGELSVARTARALVLVDGPQRVADATAARVATGTAVVRRVLPDWSSPVVVEVPASAADLDETLGAAPGTYASIAAVTTAAGVGSDRSAPVHVFVNPEVTDGLRRAGAQVVMSHELVHVATDATRTPMETWLLEGFADYVALRDVRLPDRTTLGRAIRAARVDGVPDALPSTRAFDPRAPDLEARYEEAWLACRVVAQELGERGLVGVHDAVAAGEPVGTALGAAGLPLPRLVRVWRAALVGAVR